MATVKAQNTSFFQATAIAGCQLWLDGTDPAGTGSVPTNGATVSSWVDKSGNGKNGTAVNNPTYSSSAKGINFTYSSSQYYTLPNGTLPYGDTSYSYFFIANWTGNSGPYGIVGAGILSSDQLWVIRNTTGANTIANYWYSDDITTSTTMTPGQTTCIGAFYTSGRGTRSVWINFSSGVSGIPANNRNQPNTNCTIGAAVVSQSEYMSGTISEVIVYNTSLSTTQRQQVEGYLAWKWGIQKSLPTSHPYYSIPYFAEAVYYPQAIIKTTGTNLKHPLAIAGLSLWLDGQDIQGTGAAYPIGATVTTWVDKSPFANSTTSRAGSSTYLGGGLGGYPAPYFLGSATPIYFLGGFSQTFSGTQMNCFAVASLSSGAYSAYGRILALARPSANDYGDTTTTFPFIQNNATQALIIGRNSSYLSTALPAYATPFIVQSSHNGTMEYIGVNGNLTPASQNTGIATGFNITSYGIGTNPNTTDAGSYWTGCIGEVIAFFGVALTTAQVQQIEGYLAWKWGIQASLASGHPYQTNPFMSPPYRNPIVRNNYTTRFNPKSIVGCRLWLDAIDPAGNGSTPANGSILSSWTDKSGSSLTVTGSSLQPTFYTTAFNGKPTVSFTAVQGSSYQTLTNSSTSLFNSVSTMTVFMVMYIPGTTPNFPSPIALVNKVVIYMKGGSAGGVGAGNLYPWSYNGSSVVANLNNNVSANNYYLCCFQFDTNQYFFMNGDLGTGGPVSFSFGSGTNLPLYIGYSSYNTSDGFNGYLSEILVYTSSVTTTQRRQVEGYLAWKWGLRSNLPTTHPYYTFPPSP